MKFYQKFLLSIPLQIALYIGVPALVQNLPHGGFHWIPSWDAVDTHQILKDPAPNKVVILGASYFGERYCGGPIKTPGGIADDGCMLSNILNENREKFSETKDFKFYQMTMGGTISQVHFYFLLHLLELPDNSIKYIIYDGPRKFYLDVPEREYHALHLELLKKIDSFPESMKTTRLMKFSQELKAQIAKDYAKGETPSSLRWHMFKKFIRSRRDWIFNFQTWVNSIFYPDRNHVMQVRYTKRHQELYGNYPDSPDTAQQVPLHSSDYMNDERSFEFLDLIEELCRKKGIQLVLYYSPSRVYYSWAEKEPYNSQVHAPTMKRYKNSLKFMDYRAMRFLIPADTLDGIHPSMPKKLLIADEMLKDLRNYELEKKH